MLAPTHGTMAVIRIMKLPCDLVSDSAAQTTALDCQYDTSVGFVGIASGEFTNAASALGV